MMPLSRQQKGGTKDHIPLLHSGVHFGILQATLYFIVLCNVTATFVGYFAMVLAWVGGVVLSLKGNFRLSYRQSLILSGAAYYLLLGVTTLFPPYQGLLPVIAFLIGVTALPAGMFFRTYAERSTPDTIFFHENNGFIIGNLLGLLFFLKFGIHVIHWAPLLSLIIIFIILYRYSWLPLMVYAIGAVASLLLDSRMAALIIFLLIVYTMKPSKKRPVKKADIRSDSYFGLKPSRAATLLFLSGINLILLQYIITREFSTVLAASELTILMVGTAYFVGYSIGYGISRFISYRFLVLLSVFSLFLHFILLLSVKLLSGYLIRAGMGLAVLIGLILLTSLVTSSFYSILLPRIIALQGRGSLAKYYRLDLLGAASGILFVILSLRFFPGLLYPVYFLVFVVLIYLLITPPRMARYVLPGGLALLVFLILNQDRLHRMVQEDYYTSRGYDYPRLLYAANSFYHSIDVIETYRDADRTRPKLRASFINGVRYFDYKYTELGTFGQETGLSEFTWFLAELPARYLFQTLERPLDILILGGGSLYSLRRVEPYARQTKLVEIDPRVVESARQCWSDFNHYERLEKARVIIDDAKHFLQTSDEKYDLIIMDISAPYYLGTMILHNRDFFRLIKRHLNPKGIFSESTQGRPYADRPDSQGMKILKGVVDVFPHYRVIDGRSKPRGKHGFVMASEALPFSTSELVDIMREEGYYDGTATYSERSDHFDFTQTTAFSMYNMETLLSGNQWRMQKRLKLRSKDKKQVNQFPFWGYQLPSAVIAAGKNPLHLGLILLTLGSFVFPVMVVWRRAGQD